MLENKEIRQVVDKAYLIKTSRARSKFARTATKGEHPVAPLWKPHRA